MGIEQTKQFDQINRMFESSSNAITKYWLTYSNLNSWQFWVLFSLMVLPLIALYLFIDRRKSLLLGFFGFCIHVIFNYIDSIGVAYALWNYPYRIAPYLTSLTLDASLVPVVFMLLYQWTLNNKKNYYFYSTGLCILFSFLVKPAFVTFGLFRLYKGMNYLYLLLLYLFIAFTAKWITNIFVHFQKEGDNSITRNFKLNRIFSSKEKAK